MDLIPTFFLISALLACRSAASTPTPAGRLLLVTAAAAPAPAITPTTPTTPAAAAPDTAPPPPPADLITVLSSKKSPCKSFATLLSSIPDVKSTYEGDIGGGLTLFCPTDHALSAFLPQFKNLSADSKSSLLLYQGVPVYYSVSMLKTSNGDFNTLATDGNNKNFNFTVQNAGEALTIKTGVNTATISSTVFDKDPLAVYAIDQVLQPTELFQLAEAPAPAPEAKPVKGKKKGKGVASPPAPDAPDAAPSDLKTADDQSGGGRVGGKVWVVAGAAVMLVAGIVAM